MDQIETSIVQSRVNEWFVHQGSAFKLYLKYHMPFSILKFKKL